MYFARYGLFNLYVVVWSKIILIRLISPLGIVPHRLVEDPTYRGAMLCPTEMSSRLVRFHNIAMRLGSSVEVFNLKNV